MANDLLILGLSGTGIEFEYSGPAFDITVKAGKASIIPDNEENYTRIAVYIGDERVKDMQICHETSVIHIDTTPGLNKIRLIKLSEVAMSLIGIEPLELPESTIIKPTPALSHRIEFIGDSITCGYGIDDEDPLHGFKTATEDMTRALAYKTALALNADLSCFAASGYGILSGYTDDPSTINQKELIPPYYETMGLSYDSIKGTPDTVNTMWNFSDFIPDAIVINLGTNDDSYCQDDKDKQEKYRKLYIDFLKKVRSHNKDAYIFCALGLMGDRLYPIVCSAVNEYSETTGDTKISTIHLPEQDASAGYVADYHPLESAHEKAAHATVAAIRRTLGW
ncbi:MAG: hypothetical protein K6G12_03400 [Lachnospiraceae bacterium]|nr:hypothetical protein [Lachnospiraceae bacterium]